MAKQDAGHDEWVNAWAETQAAPKPKAEPFAFALIPPTDAQPTPAAPISPDQLMRDIAEIERVRDTLAGMTDEPAATPLPQAHRYRGQPHAWLIMGAVGHTIEHAAQIRQFITAAEVWQGRT